MKLPWYIRIIPALGWMSMIFFLSSNTVAAVGPSYSSDFLAKKVAHVLVYAVLYLFISYSVKPKNNLECLLIFAVCVLYGASDELHQSLVPGRTPNLMDIGFDSLGATLSYMKLSKLI